MHNRRALGEHIGALLGGHSLVSLAKALSRYQHKIDLIRSRIYGATNALFIQGEGDVTGVSATIETAKDLRAIGHFRHSPWRYEAPGLHPFHATILQARYEFKFLVRAQIARIILQSVARAHLYDINTSCHARYLVGIEGE
jgi:hypothetical protein